MGQMRRFSALRIQNTAPPGADPTLHHLAGPAPPGPHQILAFRAHGFAVDGVGAMRSYGHVMVAPAGHRVDLDNLSHGPARTATMSVSAAPEFVHKSVRYRHNEGSNIHPKWKRGQFWAAAFMGDGNIAMIGSREALP